MSFTDKLGLASPTDLSACMPLRNSAGDIVETKDGDECWIELWGPEAEASRKVRKDLQIEQVLAQKKFEQGRKKPASRSDAEREVERIQDTLTDTVVHRTKDWLLATPDGEIIDIPCTAENVRALLTAPGYAFLQDEIVQFLSDPSNFFEKSPAS